jgi:DNA mismatch endonuclease (patch repair protein)
MDVHSKKIRSYNMSCIKGKDTRPEELVRKYLFSKGLRYRKNVKALPGCPDIVLPKYKTVVFINGCFWHVHNNCLYFKWPVTRKEFWHDKLSKNQERDHRNTALLTGMGWKVVVVWQCELRNPETRLIKLITEIKENPRESDNG